MQWVIVERSGEEKAGNDLIGTFFTQNVVVIWKGLPDQVVKADTIIIFKRHLDRVRWIWADTKYN